MDPNTKTLSNRLISRSALYIEALKKFWRKQINSNKITTNNI